MAASRIRISLKQGGFDPGEALIAPTPDSSAAQVAGFQEPNESPALAPDCGSI